MHVVGKYQIVMSTLNYIDKDPVDLTQNSYRHKNKKKSPSDRSTLYFIIRLQEFPSHTPVCSYPSLRRSREISTL